MTGVYRILLARAHDSFVTIHTSLLGPGANSTEAQPHVCLGTRRQCLSQAAVGASGDEQMEEADSLLAVPTTMEPLDSAVHPLSVG
jgi:hypothetical protein